MFEFILLEKHVFLCQVKMNEICLYLSSLAVQWTKISLKTKAKRDLLFN